MTRHVFLYTLELFADIIILIDTYRRGRAQERFTDKHVNTKRM